jgi:hypothetical protein
MDTLPCADVDIREKYFKLFMLLCVLHYFLLSGIMLLFGKLNFSILK